MEYVKNFWRDNYMFILLVTILLGILMIGTWHTDKMDMSQLGESSDSLLI